MVAANTIPEIDYTTKDFLAFKALMRRYIETNYSDKLTNFNESSLNIMTIEIVSLFGDILMFYLDRQANEGILGTANRRQSVIDILQLIDYQLATALPATDTLTVTIDPTAPSFPGYPATLPARFRVSNGSSVDPVFFETIAPLIFLASETTKAAPAFEGVTITETGSNKVGTSDGTANQSFKLSTAKVIVPKLDTDFAVAFQLTVNGVTWKRVLDFVDALSTDEVYTLTVDENDFGTVTFGNGNLGKIPPSGEIIECTYRVGGGTRGNIGVVNPSMKIISNVQWVTTVTNAGSSGGTDRESLEQGKLNGPKSLRTLQRAVSEQDHSDIALLVPGVAKAKTKSFPGTIEMDVFIAPAGGGNPSQALVNSVLNQYAIAKMAPTVVRVFSPFYQPVNIIYTLKVAKGFKQADVAANVLDVLNNFLAFDNVDFGTGVDLSDAYADVKGINGSGGVQGVDSFLIKKMAIDPIFRADSNNTGRPVFSSVTVYPTTQKREWYIVMTSSTQFNVVMREKGNSTTVSNVQLQDANVSWLLQSGTSTAVASGHLDDTTQVFATNVFAGQTLIDSAGTSFLITGNTETRITISSGTPVAGAYKVVRRFVGLQLNPSTANNTFVTIVANNENTLTVNTSLANLASAGDEYSIETTQANTGVMGTLYEDDAHTIAFTMSSGSIAPVIGDNWIMRTSEYLSDISTPSDVILEKGVFTATVFGGELS